MKSKNSKNNLKIKKTRKNTNTNTNTNKTKYRNKNKTKINQKSGAFPGYNLNERSSKEEILLGIKRFCFKNGLLYIFELMEKLSTIKKSKNPFTFRYKIAFPLADKIFETPETCLAWYEKINPGFTPVTDKTMIPLDDYGVCDYEPLIMRMVKDLLMVCLILNKLPYPSHKLREVSEFTGANNLANRELFKEDSLKNSKFLKKALECLRCFNSLLSSRQYKYLKFIDCLSMYIQLFTVGSAEPDKTNPQLNEGLTILENLKSTCFILLPTFVQINYTKVLNSCAAPVLNFRLSKERTYVHNEDRIPSFEVFHDIDFHGSRTHNLARYIPTRNDTSQREQPSPTEILLEFNKKCINLTQIYELYTYDMELVEKESELPSKDGPLTERKKYVNACILFFIIHEMDTDLYFHLSGFDMETISPLIEKFIYKHINYPKHYKYLPTQKFNDPKFNILDDFTFKGEPSFMFDISKEVFIGLIEELNKNILERSSHE
jgi:hypothetical protein